MKYTRTFKNPDVLHAMLVLRLQGWPLKELAFLFDCNHTSIRKACERNGLPANVLVLQRPYLIFRRVKTDEYGDRINVGKTYEEYLKDAKERKRHIVVNF